MSSYTTYLSVLPMGTVLKGGEGGELDIGGWGGGEVSEAKCLEEGSIKKVWYSLVG